jgi:phage terminase large subunit-like protein
MALKQRSIPGQTVERVRGKAKRRRVQRIDLPAPVAETPQADPRALQELLKDLEFVAGRQSERRMDFFKPYPKQAQFFEMGATKRERLLMAGNQLGKTEAGAFETACHMTGEYPEGWTGKRFTRPTRGWIAGETALLVRDVQQTKLCGPPGVDSKLGTGMVPKSLFADKPSLARGVTDAFDTIQIRHKSGGVSTATFKSYEQGRPKFQGEPVDWIWADEEPPMDIYSEILTRITATKGIVYVTFTPLKGMSDVVSRFLNEPSEDRGVVIMTIEDALHIAPEERERIIAGYPAHEREARARGVPMLGSGRIFQISEETIGEEAIERHMVPPQWSKGWGIDFGIGHPFAAVLCAWDKDFDVFHVLHAIRVADQKPLQHASAMKPIGVNVPVAWPQDGTAREKGSGEPLASLYKREGLKMMPDHATHPDGSLSTEAAILEMEKWMASGQFKVARHLGDWFEEYRMYHRKDGQIVKERDDLMSATRVAFMMRRFFRQVSLGGDIMKRRRESFARDIDFALF